MFCKVCDNFMDITNNIIQGESSDNKQEGGAKNKKKVEDDNVSESSDFDVSVTQSLSTSKRKKTSEITQIDIKNILNGEDYELELSDFVIDDITKNPSFKQLDENEKTLVFNRLYERLDSKVKSKQKGDNVFKGNESYFICKNCGHHAKIPKHTLIMSRSKGISTDSYTGNIKYDNYKYDHSLPRTKKYTCINDKCPTHKDPTKKMAVFSRIGNTLVLKFVCLECNSTWQTK